MLIIGPLVAIYYNNKSPVGLADTYFESITVIIRSNNADG